ncbi:hypothetical protein CCACVL1_22968 [Corchorus capsularis]|uniref:Uncharacterized protein n=1 Tax=Corchorus capsularis TaxID=210143 RepID=A0A1R3GVT2_COCAP|nr:hypothetical protein CCACVL1_22968 [Corchorus capsularis]
MTQSPTPNSTKDKPSELCNWFEEKKKQGPHKPNQFKRSEARERENYSIIFRIFPFKF